MDNPETILDTGQSGCGFAT